MQFEIGNSTEMAHFSPLLFPMKPRHSTLSVEHQGVPLKIPYIFKFFGYSARNRL